MAGKTVISPKGVHFVIEDFNATIFHYEYVFGEWSVKAETIVFEAEILHGPGTGMIADRELRSLIGKRVKVTVEVCEELNSALGLSSSEGIGYGEIALAKKGAKP